jgi:hypothetical protein
VVNFTPMSLYPRGKVLRYPLDRKFNGPKSWSGRYGEVNILDPYRNSNFDPSVVQPVGCATADHTVIIILIIIIITIEMSTKNIKIIIFLGCRAQTVRRADNITAICEPIV